MRHNAWSVASSKENENGTVASTAAWSATCPLFQLRAQRPQFWLVPVCTTLFPASAGTLSWTLRAVDTRRASAFFDRIGTYQIQQAFCNSVNEAATCSTCSLWSLKQHRIMFLKASRVSITVYHFLNSHMNMFQCVGKITAHARLAVEKATFSHLSRFCETVPQHVLHFLSCHIIMVCGKTATQM